MPALARFRKMDNSVATLRKVCVRLDVDSGSQIKWARIVGNGTCALQAWSQAHEETSMNTIPSCPEATVLTHWTSKSTSWTGLPVSSNTVPPQRLRGLQHFDASSLTLIVGGAALLTWKHQGRCYQKRFVPGHFVYIGAGCELLDVEIEAPVENIVVNLDGAPPRALANHIVGEDRCLTELVHSMRSDLLRGCPGGKLFGETASLSLRSYFYERYGHAHNRHANALAPETMRMLDEFIHANFRADLSLADLAALVHLSPRQFCRCFIEATGMPPHRYITRARIDAAKAMLATPHLSMTDIALEVGFASSSHFSDAFKKVTGLSPTGFLKAFRV